MTYEDLLNSLNEEDAARLEELHAQKPDLSVRALMILLNKKNKRAPNET